MATHLLRRWHPSDLADCLLDVPQLCGLRNHHVKLNLRNRRLPPALGCQLHHLHHVVTGRAHPLGVPSVRMLLHGQQAQVMQQGRSRALVIPAHTDTPGALWPR